MLAAEGAEGEQGGEGAAASPARGGTGSAVYLSGSLFNHRSVGVTQTWGTWALAEEG